MRCRRNEYYAREALSLADVIAAFRLEGAEEESSETARERLLKQAEHTQTPSLSAAPQAQARLSLPATLVRSA